MCYGEGLRALRKFLPRPYFVHTEGALEKYLMIINSNDEILPLVRITAKWQFNSSCHSGYFIVEGSPHIISGIADI